MPANIEKRPRIVVVDDDPGMKLSMRRLLNAAGFDAQAYTSGEEMLKSDACRAADCFILDIHLPRLSGFEIARQLNGLGLSAPVIFITAFDDADLQGKAAGVQNGAYFTKPFSGKQLIAAINQALPMNSPPDTFNRFHSPQI